MTDENENPLSPDSPEALKRRDGTTTDLNKEAQEALNLIAALQNNTSTQVRKKTGMFKPEMLLRFDVQGATTPLYVRPKSELVLGRRDPATHIVPDVDLSVHAGYQMGISRQHAIIQWEDDQLFLIDLNSRNGTYINTKRIIPNQPQKLHDGDEIRLGKMSMRIFFRTSKDIG